MKNHENHKMDIEIKPLSKDLKEDYLFFFDNIVFEENEDRYSCYCNDYHFLGDVDMCTREMSRAMISKRIDEQELHGYLAFHHDKPIGWCNTNNRSNYQRLLRDYDFVDNPKDQVCSIVCFLIHPDYRRMGIAQNLLERTIVDSSNLGYDYLEAYPRKGELSSEGSFKGPLDLYKRFDFRIHKEYDTYYVMRKSMK